MYMSAHDVIAVAKVARTVFAASGDVLRVEHLRALFELAPHVVRLPTLV